MKARTERSHLITCCIGLALLLVALNANAAINSSGVLDTVLGKYQAVASTWASTIMARASYIFWSLATISLVWTFGMLALRKADIGEFFAEFIRYIMFTGFFYWLLLNGPKFATDIMTSMETIGGTASGTPGLTPSGIVDVGFQIFDTVVANTSITSPVISVAGVFMALIVLICLALVGVNMLLLLISGWILAYAGAFFLGFGGSRWTSDMAISYFKTVLSIGAQLMAMVLLVGIGKTFVDTYYAAMSAGLHLNELAVMVIVSIILLFLVNKVPALIGAIPMGGGTHHSLGGGFGAGAAMAAGGMAGSMMTMGASATVSAVANAAGAGQAVVTATSKAIGDVRGGTSTGGDFYASQEGARAGSSPLAQAMGGDSHAAPVGMSSRVSDTAASGEDTSPSAGSSARDAQGGGSPAASLAQSAGRVASVAASAAQTAAKIAAGTATNLTAGVTQVATDKAKAGIGAARDRVSQTLGGQVASAINAKGGAAETAHSDGTPAPTFEGDSLAGSIEDTADAASEIAAFRDGKDT